MAGLRSARRRVACVLAALVLATGALRPAESQVSTGPVLKNPAQYFNADKRVRVEHATIVITENSAILYFQAAAMIRAKFPGSKAPWLFLLIRNKQNRVIPARGPVPRSGEFVQIVEASVDECGGYKNHRVDLTKVYDLADLRLAASFELSLPGGAVRERC